MITGVNARHATTAADQIFRLSRKQGPFALTCELRKQRTGELSFSSRDDRHTRWSAREVAPSQN